LRDPRWQVHDYAGGELVLAVKTVRAKVFARVVVIHGAVDEIAVSCLTYEARE